MKYELAKQLKDAGFPQQSCDWFDTNGKYCEPSMDICECSDPTLLELIEAIREENNPFGNVELHIGADGKTKASNARMSAKEDYIKGDDPEEAVAKLWLALKQK